MEERSPIVAGISSTEKLVAALRSRLRGGVVAPSDATYDAARRVWNAAVDQRPSAIAECADAEDIALAVRIAVDHGSEVTVRGGGHNVAGRSIRDGALMIDLSRLRSVVVNRGTRIANVQGGALWSNVDEATGAFGLATTGGLISTTGVGGFTLGGGSGWLMRRCGLACDNLLGATVVLANGSVARASATENAELFWALRGGTGALGVVTSFDYRLHPIAEVFAGLVVYPAAAANELLRTFRDFSADAPDEFCGLVVLTTAPPLPFLDSAWHRKPVSILALCWCGDRERGERLVAPLVSSAQPLAAHLGPVPYAQWQKALDPAAPPRRFNYWKSVNFTALGDDAIGALAEAALHLPTPQTEVHLQHLGGAVARVPMDSTAFGSRDARYFVNVIGVATSTDELAAAREGVRALYSRLVPTGMATTMPNFTDRDDGDPGASAGAVLAARLRRIRTQYDPTRVFVPR